MHGNLLINHLKEFHAKADTSNFNVLDFVSAFGNPLEALAYSYLFWPDFVEFEGMIFHQGCIENDDDRSQIRAARSEFSSRKKLNSLSTNLWFRILSSIQEFLRRPTRKNCFWQSG